MLDGLQSDELSLHTVDTGLQAFITQSRKKIDNVTSSYAGVR